MDRKDIARVALDDGADDGLEVAQPGGKAHVGERLGRRVPQPHRGDVAGLDVLGAVVFGEKVGIDGMKIVVAGTRMTAGSGSGKLIEKPATSGSTLEAEVDGTSTSR